MTDMSDQQPQQPPPPPGWYPDQQGTMRWWDGNAWTAQTAQPHAPQSSGGVSVGKLIGGIVLLFLALVGLANAGSQDFADGAERLGYFLVPALLIGGGIWLIIAALNKKS